MLTEATKEKPSIGTVRSSVLHLSHASLEMFHLFVMNILMLLDEQVIAVGPGPLDEEGNRKALSVSPGNTVLYSKYAGNDFKGSDGSNYIALRDSDVMAILS